MGIPGSEIRAEWAAQRIKDFSLANAILSILGVRRSRSTTMIERFRYPRRGPGQMWEAFAEHVGRSGIDVALGTRVLEIRHDGGRRLRRGRGAGGRGGGAGGRRALPSPLGELAARMAPSAPAQVSPPRVGCGTARCASSR